MPLHFEGPGERLSQGDLLRMAPSVWVENLNHLAQIDRNRFERRHVPPPNLNLGTAHPANAQEVRTWAVILTHDCELDNAPARAPVLIGLVRPLANMADELVESFRQNTRNRSLYLPPEGGLEGESFLDLRRVTSIGRPALGELEVTASMNDDGRLLLREQLFRFFTHKLPPEDWIDWEEDDRDGA